MTGRTDGQSILGRWGPILALSALVVFVYGRSIGYEFVFDDGLLVTGNPVSTWSLGQAPELLRSPSEGVTYRPVRMFSYMVDYALAGGHVAWVFHLSNLIWHLGTVLMVFGFASALLGTRDAGFLAAAVFAVHPLGSEAVVYVSGRRDLLLGLFSTAALWSFWLCLEAPSRVRRIVAGLGALVASVLAVGSKEIAIVLPLLAVLLWILHHRRSNIRFSPSEWALLASLTVVVLVGVVGLYGTEVWLGIVSGLDGRGLAPQPALTLRVLSVYVSKMFWPATLQADYRPFSFALPEASWDGPALVAGGLLVGWLFLGGCLLRWGRSGGLGLLWIVVALLPRAATDSVWGGDC